MSMNPLLAMAQLLKQAQGSSDMGSYGGLDESPATTTGGKYGGSIGDVAKLMGKQVDLLHKMHGIGQAGQGAATPATSTPALDPSTGGAATPGTNALPDALQSLTKDRKQAMADQAATTATKPPKYHAPTVGTMDLIKLIPAIAGLLMGKNGQQFAGQYATGYLKGKIGENERVNQQNMQGYEAEQGQRQNRAAMSMQQVQWDQQDIARLQKEQDDFVKEQEKQREFGITKDGQKFVALLSHSDRQPLHAKPTAQEIVDHDKRLNESTAQIRQIRGYENYGDIIPPEETKRKVDARNAEITAERAVTERRNKSKEAQSYLSKANMAPTGQIAGPLYRAAFNAMDDTDPNKRLVGQVASYAEANPTLRQEQFTTRMHQTALLAEINAKDRDVTEIARQITLINNDVGTGKMDPAEGNAKIAELQQEAQAIKGERDQIFQQLSGLVQEEQQKQQPGQQGGVSVAPVNPIRGSVPGFAPLSPERQKQLRGGGGTPGAGGGGGMPSVHSKRSTKKSDVEANQSRRYTQAQTQIERIQGVIASGEFPMGQTKEGADKALEYWKKERDDADLILHPENHRSTYDPTTANDRTRPTDRISPPMTNPPRGPGGAQGKRADSQRKAAKLRSDAAEAIKQGAPAEKVNAALKKKLAALGG